MGLLEQAGKLVRGDIPLHLNRGDLREAIVSPFRGLHVATMSEADKQDRTEWLAGMHRFYGEILPVQRDRAALESNGPEPLEGKVVVKAMDQGMWHMDRVDAIVKLEVDGRPVDAAMRLPMTRESGSTARLAKEAMEGSDIRVKGRFAEFETSQGMKSEFQIDSLVVDGRELAMGFDARRAQDAWNRAQDITSAHGSDLARFPKGWRAGTVKGDPQLADHAKDEAASIANAMAARSGMGR